MTPLRLFPVLLVASCASLPSVQDATAAVAAARVVQAEACSQLLYASEWHERCSEASQVLHDAEAALRAAQALESALAKEVDAGPDPR